MWLTLILVLATLASAVVGTVLNPSGRTRMLIIGFAVLTAVGTIANAFSDAREKAFSDHALQYLLFSADPSPEFVRAVAVSLDRVAAAHGLMDAGSDKWKDGWVYKFRRRGTPYSEVDAVFSILKGDLAKSFVDFSQGRNLDSDIEQMEFTSDWQTARQIPIEQVDDILEHEELVGEEALNESLSWMKPQTNIDANDCPNPPRFKISAEGDGHVAAVMLTSADFLATVTLAPALRDAEVWRRLANVPAGQELNNNLPCHAGPDDPRAVVIPPAG